MIDEAGARVRLKSMTLPPDLAELDEKSPAPRTEKDEAVKNADYERPRAARQVPRSLKMKKEEHPEASGRTASQEIDGVVDER